MTRDCILILRQSNSRFDSMDSKRNHVGQRIEQRGMLLSIFRNYYNLMVLFPSCTAPGESYMVADLLRSRKINNSIYNKSIKKQK